MKVTLEAKHGTSLTLWGGRATLDSSELLLDSMVGPTAIKNLHADLTELMASKEYKTWANPAPLAKKTSKPVKKHAKPVPKASTAKRAVAGRAATTRSVSTSLKRGAYSAQTTQGQSPESTASPVNAAPVNERPRTGSMTTAEQNEAVLEAGGTITPLVSCMTVAEQDEVARQAGILTGNAIVEHLKTVKTKVRRGRPRKTRPTVAGEVAEG